MANKKQVHSDGQTSTSTTTTTTTRATKSSGSSSSLSSSFVSNANDYKRGMVENNERLAVLLSNKRELEMEMENLYKELKNSKDIWEKEKQTLKDTLEHKIKHLEQIIDELTQEKAKLLIDYDRIKSNNYELIATNESIQKELQKLIKTSEQTIKSKDELLSQETLRSVSLENKLKSLQDQLKLNQQLEDKKIKDLRKQLEEQYMERLQSELEQELERHLDEQKRDFNREIKLYRDEIRQQIQREYEEKIDYLNDRLQQKTDNENDLNQNLLAVQNKVVQLSSIERELRDRVLYLQNELEGTKSELMTTVLKKENEIQTLERTIKERESEYSQVLTDRNSLAEEIETYRRLLDGEEQRQSQMANSGDGSTGDGLPGSLRSFGSPRRISLNNNRKRSRPTEEENHFDTFVETEGEGYVQIEDFDQEGKYVRLINVSDEPISLAGWILRRVVDNNSIDFKFGRSIVIQAAGHVTVWSKNSEGVHDLPSSIVMKGDWQTGKKVETLLLDNEKNQVYRRVTTQQVRRIKKLASHSNRLTSSQSEKCCLM